MDVKKEQNLPFEIYRERVFLREDSSKGESFFYVIFLISILSLFFCSKCLKITLTDLVLFTFYDRDDGFWSEEELLWDFVSEWNGYCWWD